MSKKMTPCEKLGYKVGDEFTLIEDSYKFGVGSVISLQQDDGTEFPYFTNEIVKDEYPSGVACFLHSIKKIAKLKPAKQAMADAIHQNGGWREQANYAVQSGGNLRIHFTDDEKKPVRCEDGGWRCQYGFMFFGSTSPLKSKLQNWHQCILSRDEYFTAYPEQVKVDIANETNRKVEVEVKSESEMTIKVGSDWHKNGELPPVGDVCEAHITSENIWVEIEVVAHKDDFVLGWCSKEKCGYHGNKNSDFRPLRTEREKAIDEMVKVCGLRSRDGAREVFGRLYDAGLYKEVKQ